MKISALLFSILLAAAVAAPAQVGLVSSNYFPADQEFPELQQIESKQTFEDPALLPKVEDGSLFADVGFEKYAKRVYAAGESGSLSVEIVTLLDARAAYSVLTLLRDTDIQTGPPGDAFTKTEEGIRFALKKHWVRIKGTGVPKDLPMKVAVSISNRIGPDKPKQPSLVSRLPEAGYDASTLRYYPGVKAFGAFSGKIAGRPATTDVDFEIAQARYSLEEKTGVLSLMSFPTPETAEDYFEGISAGNDEEVYAKKTGSLVAVLEGDFDPASANKILNSIEFSYSVRWIYEKEKPKTVWGIPGGILVTVVRPIVTVVVLGGLSVLVGIGIAILRVKLRGRARKKSPDGRDPDEITHLRLR